MQLSSQLELISIQSAKPVRSNIGEVLRTGNEAVGIEPGLLVYFRAYSGHELIFNEQRLQLVHSRDVLGVFERPLLDFCSWRSSSNFNQFRIENKKPFK